MRAQWHVSRTMAARNDGQRRWDYAYQFLLRWVMDHPAGVLPAPSHLQEDRHGNRVVRAGLDQSSAAGTDD